MTFGFGLGAGLKALTAARLAIQTAGHNVANANTEGYSRQRVLQSASLPYRFGRFQIGTGVEVTDVRSLMDEGIERRLRLQLGLSGSAELDAMRWREVEGVLDEPGAGVSTSLGELFARIDRLRTAPGDRALRGGVVQGAVALSDSLKLLAQRFGEMQHSTFGEVQGLVRTVNEHAKAVATLNREITVMEASGQAANDLRDRREQHIKEISKLVDTRAIERDRGVVDLVAGGYLLVSGTTMTPLQVRRSSEQHTTVFIGGSDQQVTFNGGRIAAALAHEAQHLPGVLHGLDRLAKELALQFNRVQTTGVPRSGPFSALTAFYGVVDRDGDGQRGDEALSQSDLPFDVSRGELWVTVRNRTSGDLERTRIAIDPDLMSVRDLAAKLDGIDHVSASVDPTGRLRVTADTGWGFDFGSHLDPAPDAFGSFGGAWPSLGGANAGPFALTLPATFTVNVNGTPHTVNLTAGDFATPGAATVDEIARAVNNQIGTHVTAKNIGGRLVVRSNTQGTAATLALTDGAGSPLAALGMPVGATATGQATGVSVAVSGTYSGSANRKLVFRPDGDGQIGVSANLTIGVFDDRGNRLTTLDVSAGRYTPGEKLAVLDGIQVQFGPGRVSATNGESFELDAIADADTSDVLVALGMNTLFVGNSAATLGVNPSVVQDSDLLAAGASGDAGDASGLARLLALRDSRLADLGGASLEDFWADVVGGIGFEVAAAEATLEAQDNVLANLEAERAAVSGVDLDAEMVDLVRFQQAFEAASRFINTVNELSRTLMMMAG